VDRSENSVKKKAITYILAGAILLGNVTPINAAVLRQKESENILSNYNTGFEGSDGEKLYWWNNASWNLAGLTKSSYQGEEKPEESCGDYYLTVTEGSGGKAQICDTGIAALLVPGNTYEFSYYAKLGEGESNQDVQFQIASISKDWSANQSATVTLESEVTLSAKWQKISGTFTMPENDKHEQVDISFVGADNLTFCIDELQISASEKNETQTGDNLVQNPNFAESDLTAWKKGAGGAQISRKMGESVADEITTYGAITDRKNNGDCFAQDMTGILKLGHTYEYSFWVMLDAEDYANAPEEQREICFAPYVKAGGKTTYWGSYSTGVLDNNSSKKIPAGEWTKISGTFTPSVEGETEAEELVIRIIEQGTNYGSGDCVRGDYYITGVSISEKSVPKKEIEWDIPDLKDTISSEDGLGSDAYAGTSIVKSELSDKALMDLVEKHFNAVTFGNELKMDALFDYHDGNNSAPGFETVTWTRADGTVIKDYKVPTLDYSRAEEMLKVIKAWNEKNPEDSIKVRGHVLVWHSQAPEWFFHKDWDKDKEYVSAEEMDIRQEWYIKTVLEHFTGKDSPYRELFYGWDVVNEAVSDGRGTYRNDTEKSSWWAVYQNEDFIINAFRYANYYAPKFIELYYNDYNECNGNKVDGIEILLKEVKSHENDAVLPTRIDGMGMQSHHQIAMPTADQIKEAAIRYGNIVGKIQLTELDIKASDEYDGTKETLEREYTKQAYRYKEIYDVMKEVDAIDGIDVNAITVWGVIDGNSWLQSQNSAGGGSDGSKKQVPLLFDDDYKAKPAFYAFVDPGKLEPFTQNIVVVQASEEDDRYENGYSYEIAGIDADFTPVWENDYLKIKVRVKDSVFHSKDEVELFIDWEKSMSEQADIQKFSLSREQAVKTDDGYEAEFIVPRKLDVADGFLMDLVVNDNGQKYAFNDLRMTQESSSKYYASALTKPFMTIPSGTVTVDGEIDTLWNQIEAVPFTIKTGSPKASANGKLAWDKEYLYALIEVKDPELNKTSSAVHEQDSVEVFIDENNHKSDSYEDDDKQYRINFENEASFNGPNCKQENLISVAKQIEGGYLIEAAFRWTEITPKEGEQIGLELQINDGAGGTRIGTVSWYDESGQGWSSPSVFGNAKLSGAVDLSQAKVEKLKDITIELGKNGVKKEEIIASLPTKAAVTVVSGTAVQAEIEWDTKDLKSRYTKATQLKLKGALKEFEGLEIEIRVNLISTQKPEPVKPSRPSYHDRDDDDDDEEDSSYQSVLTSKEQSTVQSVLGNNMVIQDVVINNLGKLIISTKMEIVFYEKDGTLSRNKWQKVGNDWYYFGADCKAVNGWLFTGNKWYYLNQTDKKMKTGWIKTEDGKWYLLDSVNGDMKTGWQQRGGKWYLLDSINGDMKTGWQQRGGKWYLLDSVNGDMKTGWQQRGGKWYLLDSVNGDMKTGWQQRGGKWYLLDSINGDMKTGWQQRNGKWYYLASSGEMAANTVTPDGYTVGPSGEWIP